MKMLARSGIKSGPLNIVSDLFKLVVDVKLYINPLFNTIMLPDGTIGIVSARTEGLPVIPRKSITLRPAIVGFVVNVSNPFDRVPANISAA
jgi:hypothetical protein